MKKRVLSVILALCMCMSLLPTTAGAVEPAHTDHCVCGDDTCSVGDHSNSTLSEWKKLTWDSENSKLCVDGSALTTTYVDAEQCYSLVSGNYYLGDSFTLNCSIYVSAESAVTLCLNCETLTSTVTSTNGSIKVDGSLNLCDCTGTGALVCKGFGVYVNAAETTAGSFTMYGGTIRCESSNYQKSGVFLRYNVSNSGAYPNFTMYDGIISGFKDGGVQVSDYGTFTMHGGIITSNTRSSGGGGVFCGSNSTFTMCGGTISGNTAGSDGSNYGGGVFVKGTFTMNGGKITGNTGYGAGVNIDSDGTFIMNGGSITYNEAPSGGGVYSYGSFVMNGGAITGNTAKYNGGGVYVGNSFTLSGGAVIEDNIKSNSGNKSTNNVYLGYNTVAVGVDGLCEGACIGVNAGSNPSEGSPVAIGEDNSGYYSSYFFSDNPAYEVVNDSGVLKLQVKSTPAPIPADTPSIGTNLSTTEVSYDKDTTATALNITASVTDSGTLTYQWYSNTTNSTSGAQAISGATSASFTPPTSATGTTYYYCVVTNTKDGQTATATSNIAMITVSEAAPAPNPTTYTVSGDVKDTTAGEATVKLMQGNTEVKTATVTLTGPDTSFTGTYSFTGVAPGVYNVVAVKDGVTMTVLVTVTNADVTVGAITMPSGAKNSIVNNLGADDFAAVVGGLDKIAGDTDNNAYYNNKTVIVELTVTKKTEQSAPAVEVSKIKELASGKALEFVDLSLSMKINEDAPVNIGGSNTYLLTIVIPFDTSKEGIEVYRYHGNGVQTLTDTVNSEGEKIEVGDGSITIYAKKFSTYAIGYTATGSGSGTPGGQQPARPNRSPSSGTSYVHACVSKCQICGGCTDEKCSDKACAVKCKLVSMSFEDVTKALWCYDAVEFVYHYGLMQGYGEDEFYPDGNVTRQQVWMVLARMSGADPKSMAAARLWAVENGVSDGSNPTAYITRQQLATMLWRYAKLQGKDVSVGENTNILSYTDAFDIAEYAIPAVQWACGEGIIGGYNDGSVKPMGNASRGHMAAFLQRFCEAVK